MSLFASLGTDDIDDSLWGEGGLFSNNPVQDILDREEGFTLEELLEEDELIQEVKHLNSKLIDFLSMRSTVSKLTTYITRDDTKDEVDIMNAAAKAEASMNSGTGGEGGENPSSGEALLNGMPQSVLAILHEREKLGRFAYTASEIFCCEVPGVNCHLVETAKTIAKRTAGGGDGSCDATPEQLPGVTSILAAAARTSSNESGTMEEKKEEKDEKNKVDEVDKKDEKVAGVVEDDEEPLISKFFAILHRPVISPRTAGFLEKIVDVFLSKEQESLMNWVDQHPGKLLLLLLLLFLSKNMR